MASLDQLKTALRNAEARGATQDAALLANAIKERTPAPARDRAAEEAARNLQLSQLQPGSFGQGVKELGKGSFHTFVHGGRVQPKKKRKKRLSKGGKVTSYNY